MFKIISGGGGGEAGIHGQGVGYSPFSIVIVIVIIIISVIRIVIMFFRATGSGPSALVQSDVQSRHKPCIYHILQGFAFSISRSKCGKYGG